MGVVRLTVPNGDVPALSNFYPILTMNHSDNHTAYPDTTAIPSALELGDEWDSEAIFRTLQDPVSRRPAWRDHETDALWQFRI